MPKVSTPASTSDELPPPSPEAVLLRVLVEAYIATTSRKRAEAFLRVASEILATEESLSDLFPIRPAADAGAVAKARRGALSLFRQMLPVWLARVPGG